MHKTTRLKLADVNPHLLCVLCGGYFIDATCIIECLHSFCRSCITKYLEGSKCCPICDVQVHKTRPLLNLRPDKTLQTLVYKLIPGVYREEMSRRKEFYKQHPDSAPSTSLPNASEERGESDPDRYNTLEDPEKVSLVLQHCDRLPLPSNNSRGAVTRPNSRIPDRRYLLCPSMISVAHLKKFIRCKFDIHQEYQIEVFYDPDETLSEDYTLADVAYVYSWTRAEPLRLFYVVLDTKEVCLTLPTPIASQPIVLEKDGAHHKELPNSSILAETEPATSDRADPTSSTHEVPSGAHSSRDEPSIAHISEERPNDSDVDSQPDTTEIKAETPVRPEQSVHGLLSDCHFEEGLKDGKVVVGSPIVFCGLESPKEPVKEHSRKHSHKKKKKKKKHKRSKSKEDSDCAEEHRTVIKVRIPKDKISPHLFDDSAVFDTPEESLDGDSQFDFTDIRSSDQVDKKLVMSTPISEDKPEFLTKKRRSENGSDFKLLSSKPNRKGSLESSVSNKTQRSCELSMENHLDTKSLLPCESTDTGLMDKCTTETVSEYSNLDKASEVINYSSQISGIRPERITELKEADMSSDSQDVLPETGAAEDTSFFSDSEPDSSFETSQANHKEYTCEISVDGKVLLHSSKGSKQTLLPSLDIVVEETPPEVIVVEKDTSFNVNTLSLSDSAYQSSNNISLDTTLTTSEHHFTNDPVSGVDTCELNTNKIRSTSVSPSGRRSACIGKVETDQSVLVEVDESGVLVDSLPTETCKSASADDTAASQDSSHDSAHDSVASTKINHISTDSLSNCGRTNSNQTLGSVGLSKVCREDGAVGGSSPSEAHSIADEPMTSARTDAHAFSRESKDRHIGTKQTYGVPHNVHSSLSPPYSKKNAHSPLPPPSDRNGVHGCVPSPVVKINAHSSLSPPSNKNSLKRAKTTESGYAYKQPKLSPNQCTIRTNGISKIHPIAPSSAFMLPPVVDSETSTSSVTWAHYAQPGVHSSLSPPDTKGTTGKLDLCTTGSVDAHGFPQNARDHVRQKEASASSAGTSNAGVRIPNVQHPSVSPTSSRKPSKRGPLKERPITLPVSRTATPVKSPSVAPKPRVYSSLHSYPLYQTHVHPSLSAISAIAAQVQGHGAFSPPAVKQLRLMCGEMGLPSTGQIGPQSLPPHRFALQSPAFLAHSRHFLSPIFSPPLPNRSLPSPMSPTRASPLSPNHFAPVSPAHFGPMSPPRLSPPGMSVLGLGAHLQVPGYDSPLELTTRKAQDRFNAVGSAINADRS